MKKISGFSLVEMGVVIGIIVILLVIGVPSTNFFIQNIQLTGTAREITSELRYANQQAVTEQINYVVKFSIEYNRYSLYRLPDPDHPENEEFIEQKDLPSSVTFQSVTGLTDNQVRFNSAGAPSDSGQITIVNTQEKTRVINIRPSGYIKIE